MLPSMKTKAIAATLAATLAAAPVTPALAWGKGEQNFLAGALAAVGVGLLINQANKAHASPRPVYPSTPVYSQPTYRPPVYQQPTYQQPTYQAPIYGSSVSAARSAFLNYSPTMRRAIQARLSDYGYYRGTIDGVWGPRTDAALRAYAADQGLAARLGTYSGAVAVLDSLAA
jgi:hypothetical protein